MQRRGSQVVLTAHRDYPFRRRAPARLTKLVLAKRRYRRHANFRGTLDHCEHQPVDITTINDSGEGGGSVTCAKNVAYLS